MSKLSAIRGALATAALSLALGAQAEVIEITINPGSQTSPTATGCSIFDLTLATQDCTYTDTKDPALGGGPWIGPRTRDGFFAPDDAGGNVLVDTGVPANPGGIALSGTISIDTQGTASCADDTISGVIEMAPFKRNFVVSGARAYEIFPNGITQTIAPQLVSDGAANADGGCDYFLGEAGVAELLTGNYGDFPGNPPGGDQPGANPVLAWTAPGNVEISVFQGTTTPNPGIQATATLGAGYSCTNNAGACLPGTAAAPNNGGGFTFAWNTAGKASWNNITGVISTNAAGDITDSFLYLVHDNVPIVNAFFTADQLLTYFAYTAEITGAAEGPGGPLPPVANDDTATVNQDQSVEINVLANDTNLTDPVTVTIASPPANGTAIVNGSPGAAAGISITYTPDAGFAGSDSFVYTVSDENDSDSATVSVTINEFGANDDTASTRLNTPVIIDVLANDVGFDDPVTVSIILSPDNGGSAEVVDSEGNVVVDGTGDQGNLRIRFTPDAALGTPTYTESFTYEVASTGLAQPTSAGTYLLSSVVSTVPFGVAPAATFNSDATAVVDGDGNVTLTAIAFSSDNPNAGYNYSGGDWTTELGTAVTVTKLAESCTNTAGDSCDNAFTGLLGDWVSGFDQNGEPTGLCTSTFIGTCGDLEGEPLSNVDVFIDGDQLVISRRARFLGDPGNPGFFTLPNTLDLTFTLEGGNGGGVTDTAEVTVTVNNALPVANDTTVNVSEAAVRAVNPNTLVQQVNVATIAGNSLGDAPATVTVGAQTNGTATVNGTTVSVTPAADAFGGTSVTVEYTITDVDGESDSGVITVAIPDVAPTLNDGSGSVQAGQSTTVALAFTGGNGSVAQHTLAVTTQATSGSCALDGASVVYTAGAEAGSFSCVVTLTDGDGDADTGTFTFTVTAAPPPPDSGIRLPGGSSSMDLLGLALLAGLPLLRRRRRLS